LEIQVFLLVGSFSEVVFLQLPAVLPGIESDQEGKGRSQTGRSIPPANHQTGCKRSNRLQTIKQAKLVLDWRKRLRPRADVYSTVKKILDELPRTYTPEVYQAKCDTIYNHIFEKYQGEGVSVYSTV